MNKTYYHSLKLQRLRPYVSEKPVQFWGRFTFIYIYYLHIYPRAVLLPRPKNIYYGGEGKTFCVLNVHAVGLRNTYLNRIINKKVVARRRIFAVKHHSAGSLEDSTETAKPNARTAVGFIELHYSRLGTLHGLKIWFGLIHLRLCQYDNGNIDGRSQI